MPDPTTPGGPGDAPRDGGRRTLAEIIDELGDAASSQPGETTALRGAVLDLSEALAGLFDTVRADQREQRRRIAQLEAQLRDARAELAALRGRAPGEPAADRADFDRLRDAAERLRRRTEQLLREAGPAGDAEEGSGLGPRRSLAAQFRLPLVGGPETGAPVGGSSDGPGAAGQEMPPAEGEAPPAGSPPRPQDLGTAAEQEPGAGPRDDAEERELPGVLRVFPGASLPPSGDELAEPIATPSGPAHPPGEEPELPIAAALAHLPGPPARDAPDAPSVGEPEGEPGDGVEESGRVDDGATDPDPGEREPAAETERSRTPRSEPIVIAPRPARARRLSLRRRRIDARRLAEVEPLTALRAMVSSIPDLWTAGFPLDLVVACTDGATMKISGGDTRPLLVEEVEPGAPARTTVTLTRGQVVPLFGRLGLSPADSAPMIHGARRDADLLVGWLDRAQRLEPQPL